MEISKGLLPLTKDNILMVTSEDSIFKHYLGNNVTYGSKTRSPFRKDRRPSFSITHKLRWKDFATGESGSCFDLVMKLYNVSYRDALAITAKDLNLSHLFNIPLKTYSPIKVEQRSWSKGKTTSGPACITIHKRSFMEHDRVFWASHGISEKLLRKGNVYPLSSYTIDGTYFKAEKYSYAYLEYKDGKPTIKIYQPFSKYRKWASSNDSSVWELWNLLPKEGDRVIISSSRKDSMSLMENLNIPSTSLQAEGIHPKKQVMEEILQRFRKVYIFYDNDFKSSKNWGQLNARRLLDKYPLINIKIPDNLQSKDFSDLVKNHKQTVAVNTIQALLT